MNTARQAVLALLTAAVALPALADAGNSGVTRDQVKAEYLRALKAGELDYSREFIDPFNTSSRAGATTAASSTQVENLSPTGAGAQTAAVTPAKTPN